MTTTKKSKDQPATFHKLALELGCDEDEGRFDAALKRVAKAPPKDEKPKDVAPHPAGDGDDPLR